MTYQEAKIKCRDCSDRHQGCHTGCEVYQILKDEAEKRYAERAKDNLVKVTARDLHVHRKKKRVGIRRFNKEENK